MAEIGFGANLVRTLVSTATKRSHRHIMGKMYDDNNFIFDQLFIRLTNNKDRHKISDKYNFGPPSTIGIRITSSGGPHRL